MSESTDDLITKAQQQLDEHKEWLRSEINAIPVRWEPGLRSHLDVVRDSVEQIKLRVAKVSGRIASVVYEYPDELVVFLRAETTPKHLRDSLAGGHVVDPSQRTFTATREVE